MCCSLSGLGIILYMLYRRQVGSELFRRYNLDICIWHFVDSHPSVVESQCALVYCSCRLLNWTCVPTVHWWRLLSMLVCLYRLCYGRTLSPHSADTLWWISTPSTLWAHTRNQSLRASRLSTCGNWSGNVCNVSGAWLHVGTITGRFCADRCMRIWQLGLS